MTTLSERRKKSQGGTSNFVTLNVTKRYEIGKSSDDPNQTVFKWWNKDEKENYESISPIIGIYLGYAIQLVAYSPNLGSKGGSLTSSPYLTPDKIALFDERGNFIMEDHFLEIQSHCNSEGANVKKLELLHIFTKDEGLISVRTNQILAIDQLKRFKEELQGCMMVLTPQQYDPEDKTITTKAKGHLTQLAVTNKPRMAYITIGSEILQQDETPEYQDALTNWEEWVKFKEKGGSDEVKEEKESNDTDSPSPSLSDEQSSPEYDKQPPIDDLEPA